jgi:hypothetical protein
MSSILFLNQPQVGVGLQSYTFTVPAAGTVVPYGGAGIYNVQFNASFPNALPIGDGAGSGFGLGAGAGGGDAAGFARGGLGTGDGAVGQGFGANLSGYQQPPASGSNATLGAAVSTALSIVVNQNGSPVYTSPALTPSERGLQFKVPLNCSVTDVITVVMASANQIDKALNTIQSTVSINQGM